MTPPALWGCWGQHRAPGAEPGWHRPGTLPGSAPGQICASPSRYPSASGAAHCWQLSRLPSPVSGVGGAVPEPEMGSLKESPPDPAAPGQGAANGSIPKLLCLGFPLTPCPPPHLQQCPAQPLQVPLPGHKQLSRWSWGWPGTLGMEVGMFNQHILMFLSTQLGQVQSASWFGASSHFPDDNTALCQPLVLSVTGRRVIKNGHYGELTHWGSSQNLSFLACSEQRSCGEAAWPGEGTHCPPVLPKML